MDLWRITRVITLGTFFKLAEEKELGRGGYVPKYPGAAFLAFVVEWSDRHGKMPSEVFQQYLENPKDFQLLMAFRGYKAEKEKQEIEKAESKSKNLG